MTPRGKTIALLKEYLWFYSIFSLLLCVAMVLNADLTSEAWIGTCLDCRWADSQPRLVPSLARTLRKNKQFGPDHSKQVENKVFVQWAWRIDSCRGRFTRACGPCSWKNRSAFACVRCSSFLQTTRKSFDLCLIYSMSSTPAVGEVLPSSWSLSFAFASSGLSEPKSLQWIRAKSLQVFAKSFTFASTELHLFRETNWTLSMWLQRLLAFLFCVPFTMKF